MSIEHCRDANWTSPPLPQLEAAVRLAPAVPQVLCCSAYAEGGGVAGAGVHAAAAGLAPLGQTLHVVTALVAAPRVTWG